MAVTITDVAAEAGVSKATVSRVFGAPDRVNAATRSRVLEVAERLGYAPVPAPRSSRTGSIGLIVPDIVNPFFPPMIKAVQRRAGSRNYGVYLADSDARPGEETEAVAMMAKQVDGLIFWSSRLPGETLASIAYDIMPYEAVRPELYVRAAEAILANDRALAEKGLARLREVIGGKRWMALDEAEQVAALESVQGSDFFAYMRSTTINTLFVDPAVWAMVGYGGSAVEHGGYINRGFDEIDWLPAGGE